MKELLHKKKDFICEQRLMKGSLRRVTFKLRERAVLSVLDFYLKHFDEVAVKFFFLSIQDEYFGCYQISKCPS